MPLKSNLKLMPSLFQIGLLQQLETNLSKFQTVIFKHRSNEAISKLNINQMIQWNQYRV